MIQRAHAVWLGFLFSARVFAGTPDVKRVEVLWSRFSVEVPASARPLYVDDLELIEVDGFPTDERVWLDVKPDASEPTFMLVAQEQFAVEGKAGLLTNKQALVKLATHDDITRTAPHVGDCGQWPCIEYEGSKLKARFVTGFLVAVNSEVLSVDFVTYDIEGELVTYLERAREIMRTFRPGNRRLRTGDRASIDNGGCCGNSRLTFPTPPGFGFTARLNPYVKVLQVRELNDPEAPHAEPIELNWILCDASTSPTNKKVAGTLWGTPMKWTIEKSGSRSFSFWNFDLDPRHNQLVVTGLRTRPKQTQALIDGIDWDGIGTFRKVQTQ